MLHYSIPDILGDIVYTHIVNFYLAPIAPPRYSTDPAKLEADRKVYQEKSVLQEKIVSLAADYSSQSQTILEGYAREALRTHTLISDQCVVFDMSRIVGTL